MRIIAGEWKSRRLAPVPGGAARSTSDRVREAWMSILHGRIRAARAADLFAGSGALGLELLSRGAAHVTFVEAARRAASALERNITALDAAPRCFLLRGNAIKHVRRVPPRHYDLAVADPPYDRGYAWRLAEIQTLRPFARELWIEHRATEAIPAEAAARQRRYGDTALTQIVAGGGFE